MDLTKVQKRIFKGVNENEGKKYILLLLNSLDQKPIKGKTKFMKELFFIAHNVPSLYDLLKFEPDNYGPNSDVVSRYLEEMSQLDLIKFKNRNTTNKDSFKYFLGNYGKKIMNELNTEEIDKELLDDIKSLFDGLTFNETLALTYYTYPEMTEESLVMKEIESKREKLSLNLYKKGKISAAKASEIANIPLTQFLDLLKEKKIPMELLI
ncbi:MAG: UPF0175 family protein [Methanobrevibacter sp.]|jgi:predicted HTH domain antitoxin|nr:UPF0175 family protein [Candidatus Methanovirga australis]